MATNDRETEVVIAGAGPTGLLLATELALAGVGVVVIEQSDVRTGQSKALNLQPRSAEILTARGLLDPLLEAAQALIPAGHYAGLPLDYADLDTRYPYQIGIPQAQVEKLLETRLAEQGIPVRYGARLTGFTQDADGVDVHVTGGPAPLRADYLVGCDGGHSTVRTLLGVPFIGRDPRMSAVVADITLADPAGAPTEWQLPSLTAVDGVILTMTPLGDNVFRMLTAGPEQLTAERNAPVTADELSRALAHGHYGTLRLDEVRWASRFTDTTKQVQHYRTHRVLLAGDAAHVHSPTGGQGLNLGLQDAFNLGWKLAATIRGTAPSGLLDTYHDERHPVAARVLANTLAQGVLMVPDADVAALRGVVTDLLQLPEANRQLAKMISGLDIRYPLPGAHPRTGGSMPDLDILSDNGPTTVSQLLHEGRGILLRLDNSTSQDIGAALVRPDGYLAWAAASGGHDDAGLEDATARWFGNQSVREVRATRYTPRGARSLQRSAPPTAVAPPL
ncbi:MAG TPA: FAD-dependent monooxygenase [Kineosporiaceae bacterium]|nr:FAD-dependent monooxygenase [Kineosporiaceae bacterium]